MDIRRADARYSGTSGPIFQLAMKVAFLSLITLGIYRFWGKTRLRKYIWSSAEMDGSRFEYTGTGLEKFLGFLIAVVFLAIYLGIIQMILFYFGLNLFIEPQTEAEMLAQMGAIYITFFAALPFILFAIYRARRYKLARTRWRGIRFGMEKGAWGYVWRALAHGLLSVVTLGLLLPRQTFYLEKYMTDRMWFGDAQFHQGGKWTGLYRAFRHVLIGAAVLIGGIALGAMLDIPALAMTGAGVGYIWLTIGFIAYRVQGFGYLTSHKSVDGDITMEARPNTGTVILTYVVGGIVIGVASAIALAVLGLIGFGGAFSDPYGFQPSFFSVVVLAVGYIAIILGAGAAAIALITQPVIAHYVDSFTLINLGALDGIQQRAADTGADAEGFADALDIGGAI